MTDKLKVISINKDQPAVSADVVLKEAVGDYESVIIIGYDTDGEMEARASLNLDHKAIVFLLEVFKQKLISGDYSDE